MTILQQSCWTGACLFPIGKLRVDGFATDSAYPAALTEERHTFENRLTLPGKQRNARNDTFSGWDITS